MRKLAVLSVIAVVALAVAPATAQQASERPFQPISHGDFAVLLMKTVSGAPQQIFEPADALAELAEIELVPSDWDPQANLIHGELAAVALRIGSMYTPADPASAVSRDFAEVFLRRQADRLRDYRAQRPGQGFATSHVLDQGVDRAISNSDFN